MAPVLAIGLALLAAAARPVRADPDSRRVVGRVLAAESGSPLAGAVVQVVGTELAALTGADGTFTIDGVPSGVVELAVTLPGRHRARAAAPVGVSRVVVRLRADETAGSEVIEIEGEETEETRVRRSAFPVAVVSTAELANRATGLTEVIDRVAGIKVRQTGGLGSDTNVTIRGLGGKRVQIYIDGRALNLAGVVNLDDIPVQFIERVEIYKGVVPARFGGDGVAGAVNIVTKDLAEEYSEASYTLQSYGTHLIAGAHTMHVADRDDITFGFGGLYNHADNDYVMESPYQPGLEIRRDHDQYSSAVAVASLELDDFYFDKLESELIWLRNRKQIQGVQQNIQHAHSASDLLAIVLEAQREDFLARDLDLDYSLSVPVVRSRFIDDSPLRYGFDGTSYPSPTGRGEIGPLPHRRRSWTVEARQRINLDWKLDPGHTINANSAVRASWLDSTDPLADQSAGRPVGDRDGRLLSSVTAVAHELTWGRFSNVITGKHHAFSSSGQLIDIYAPQEPEPITVTRSRFGLAEAARLHLGGELYARAAYERSWRLPDASELFGDGFLVSPSPALRPEAGHSFSAGMLLDRIVAHGRLHAEVNGFATWLSDAITLGSNPLSTGYVNLGEVRVLGADGELKADVAPWLHLHLAGTCQDLRDVRELMPGTNNPNPTFGLRVPNVPWLYGTAGFELHWSDLASLRDEVRAYWSSSYVAEYFYGWHLSDNQEQMIPSAMSHTAGVELSFDSKRINVSFEVDNLTDATVIDVFNNPLPGRTFKVKARIVRF